MADPGLGLYMVHGASYGGLSRQSPAGGDAGLVGVHLPNRPGDTTQTLPNTASASASVKWAQATVRIVGTLRPRPRENTLTLWFFLLASACVFVRTSAAVFPGRLTSQLQLSLSHSHPTLHPLHTKDHCCCSCQLYTDRGGAGHRGGCNMPKGYQLKANVNVGWVSRITQSPAQLAEGPAAHPPAWC